jgi:hypothetical protein
MTPDDALFIRQLRFGGRLAILSVVLFTLSAFGAGSFIATSVTLPKTQVIYEYSLDQPPLIFAWLRYGSLVSLILVPLGLWPLFQAQSAWMRRQFFQAESLRALLGASFLFWMLAGGLRVFLLPAADSLAASTRLTVEDWYAFIFATSAAILDLAFFLFALYMLGASFFYRQEGIGWFFILASLNSVVVLLALLLGPFERLNPLGVFAYGVPVGYAFTLAVYLLRYADKLQHAPLMTMPHAS